MVIPGVNLKLRAAIDDGNMGVAFETHPKSIVETA